MTWLAIGLAGALGASCRYVVHQLLGARGGAFPWGTLTVNLLGSVLLGVVVAVAAADRLSPTWAVAAAAGFCGAFTTFSTWMVETVALLETRDWWRAAANLASLAAGVLAVALGVWLGATVS